MLPEKVDAAGRASPNAAHVDTVPSYSSERLAPQAAHRPFKVGELVGGGYRIEGVLGTGGMGVVYDALDIALDRSVALKVPLLREHAQRLRKEAQAMAAVRHPNLVSVYAVGQHDGVDFLVMERLAGTTLEARIEKSHRDGRPLPIDEVLVYLIAIADALSAVHRAGLAHRDVKTSNVMVCGHRIVLADFGLVLPEVDVIKNRTVAGSVDYMAPELITASVRPGDGPLVDLYALGVVAFELLAGRAPFEDEAMDKVLKAHLHKAPPDLATLRPDAPAALCALVEELLEKAPENRPDSSETLLWRLSALQIVGATPLAGSRLGVLIVDDQEEVCAILRRSLTFCFPRISVETMTDPVRALSRIENDPPDILVFDINMPRVNGIELAMDVLSLPEARRPVLVAMSAETNANDLGLLVSLGLTDFVPKDSGFVARMCGVIGDARRRRQGEEQTRASRAA